jgi:acyl-lipid omega-6 desaturase (Delta-12 desaturase)
MVTSTYQSVRQALNGDGAFRISNVYGALTVAAELLIAGGLLTAITAVEPFAPAYWLLQALFAVSMFRMFVIVHECGHNNLFRGRNANTIAGVLASPFCLLPYVPWRNIHFLHHKWVGVIDKDPTQAHLLTLRDMSRAEVAMFRIVWKLWIPIPFMLFVWKMFWMYPYREWRYGARTNVWRSLPSVLVCGLPHALLVAYVGIWRYATLCGPAIALFYAIYEVINLPQHSGLFPYTSRTHPAPLPLREQAEITRTTYLPRLLAVVLNYNFNFHIEHHLFPSVPWYSLPKVTSRIAGLRDFDYQRVGCFTFMVHLRRRDPVDVYVNSLPSLEKEHA